MKSVFPDRMSLGTGRPIVLRDESTIRNCRVLLSHPMASPTDVRLISQIDLIAQKSMCSLHLHPFRFGTHNGPACVPPPFFLPYLSSDLRDAFSAERPGEPQHARIHPAGKYLAGQMVGGV